MADQFLASNGALKTWYLTLLHRLYRYTTKVKVKRLQEESKHHENRNALVTDVLIN